LTPPATGVRLPWPAAPATLRQAVEAELGGPVIESATQPGGFSPGVAARLLLANGRRAFVKAVGPQPNPDSPSIHRAEARIAAALPAAAPAPRLLACFDQGGWVALLFEDIDGVTPAQPCRPDELGRVLAALVDLADSLTPTPVKAPRLSDTFGDQFKGWRRLAAAHRRGEDDLAWLDAWARRHLDRLAGLEAGWGEGAAGDTLVHADVRADNVLLTPSRVVFVDWPWASIGAAWFDLLAMLPSVHMQGGPEPEPLLADHPVAQDADPVAVTAVLAALTGFFLRQSHQPAPPGLPTLRAFQEAQGHAALAWLRVRTGWP
jgi:aminoglycoside phosphotransferase (APT) family kinase protein